MYESYWGLQAKPFENTPDPRFYYASPQHQEASARMLYCIRERKGAGMLTGVFGCGKTVVSQVILNELNQERYRFAYVANPRLSDLDILRMVAHHLGVVSPPANKADTLMALEQIVNDNAKEGRDTVIVIDEAHTIHDAGVFEELRLLLNFQWHDRFLVTLILIGQPELVKVVETNKPFEQRIGIKARLEPLSLEETQAYIFHRLRVAGHADPESVFAHDAIASIYDSTGGIPRRINRLCDICLLSGMGLQAQTINAQLIGEEARALTV